MEWVSVKERMPPISFVETDNPDVIWEAIPILLYIPHDRDPEILVGCYEEEVLSPFPNIASWRSWNGENWHHLELEPSHWMPLPQPPKEEP